MNDIVLELPPRRGNPRNSEAAFATLSDGRVLMVWSRFEGGRGDNDAATLAARVSIDQGRTWSEEDRIVLRDPAALNVMSPSLVRAADGHLDLYYLRTMGFHDSRLHRIRSSDEGASWSEPVCLFPAPGYFVVNNDRLLRTASGRLVAPAAFHRLRGADPLSVKSFDPRGIALFYLSDDDGASWREARQWWTLNEPDTDSGLQEPGVVELEAGHLFAWCRTDRGTQYGLDSADDGETWTRPYPTGFESPCSPLSIKRLPGGELLAVWNDHSGRFDTPEPMPESWGRTPLVSAISRDKGRSWENHRLLEDDPGHGYCYIAIHATEDRHVLLAYSAGGGEQGYVLDTLRVRRLALEYLLKTP
ncbi:MAG: exo-alpha-sialidase [Chromatiales bacterium]|nr:exo-alpha-sialidase [Chromatiales bacterium]